MAFIRLFPRLFRVIVRLHHRVGGAVEDNSLYVSLEKAISHSPMTNRDRHVNL